MTKMLRWNGRDLPEELRSLPPGDYVIESVLPFRALTEDEEQGIEEGLDEIERGETLSAEDVYQSIDPRRKK